jgi:hypothetical protein
VQHAHLVAISLIVFAFTTPLVMVRNKMLQRCAGGPAAPQLTDGTRAQVSWTNSVWVAILMDALAVTVYFALNEARHA